MRLIDITRTLQEAPVYPGDESTVVTRTSELMRGAECNVSHIATNSHAGTHADACSHYFADGATIDQMPLSHYYGDCRVLTIAGGRLIGKDALIGRIAGVQRLVLRGGGERYLTPEAAEYIRACGVITVVTDALSVAPREDEASVHRRLLGGGVAVIENTVLDDVLDGAYTLVAFPLKVGGCDGAPVRAALVSADKS